MTDLIKENKSRKNSKIVLIKNFDKFIGNCTVENLQILGDQLRIYHFQGNLIQKNSEHLKDLIQLLFKYLMDGNKNLEEDIIGCFKEEEIFTGIKNIYSHEDYDINCTIIQSLSILLVNIVKSKAFLYFVLSNNFVNDLLLIDYSKYDDEYYSYYVNFLKSLVMRLDRNTFLLFYNKRSNIFPLLDCSLNLYNYSNAMTRTVVNNILLQILKSNIDEIYDIFSKLPSINYFSFLSLRMKDLINDLCLNMSNLDPYEDLTDLTLFINDILSLGKEKINFLIRNAIFYYFLLPEIFQSLYTLIYGFESIKGKNNNNLNNKKESVIILCLITFLINIKDETIKYIILQLLLSDYIPEQLDKYILQTPETNPFYSYKWDKDFQKKIDFTKFISLNYSNEFLGSFINKDNYYFQDIERTQNNKLREMKNIRSKCEEINERLKIDENHKDEKENIIYEMSQFVFDLFNEKEDGFGFMKNYHQNLGLALGIKVGVIKEMFQNPKKNSSKMLFKVGERKNDSDIDFKKCDLIKDCFMCNYKFWMDNLNKTKTDFKMKPNVYKIILFNLLNNENNINVNIPLVIANNYFIWAIIHKLKIPSKILNHFYLQLNSSSTDIDNPKDDDDSTKDKDDIYNKFIFDEKYLIKKLNEKDIDYKTNNIIIEKLCLNLENKILLAKIDLIYIELICKNINYLCLGNKLNIENEVATLKSTSINLIKLLKNIMQIPSDVIEQNTSVEEIVCCSLEKLANNLYDDSFFNKQLGNLPKIMEVISEYEANKNVYKGNLVKNLVLSVLFLINILERIKQKNNCDSPFRCLYKKKNYVFNDIVQEKDINDSHKNRFAMLYKKKLKVIFYDDIFLYSCYLANGINGNFEINNIIFINNSNESNDKLNDKLLFKINNEVIFNFNSDEEGEMQLKQLENMFKEMRDNVKNDFSKNVERFNLESILKYVEQL